MDKDKTFSLRKGKEIQNLRALASLLVRQICFFHLLPPPPISPLKHSPKNRDIKKTGFVFRPFRLKAGKVGLTMQLVPTVCPATSKTKAGTRRAKLGSGRDDTRATEREGNSLSNHPTCPLKSFKVTTISKSTKNHSEVKAIGHSRHQSLGSYVST